MLIVYFYNNLYNRFILRFHKVLSLEAEASGKFLATNNTSKSEVVCWKFIAIDFLIYLQARDRQYLLFVETGTYLSTKRYS